MPRTPLPRFPLLTAKAIAAMKEYSKPHLLNPRAVRHTKGLSDALGLHDIGVHLVRLAPGGCSTEYHTHYCDEEFIYILSGNGRAEIGSRKVKIAAGDFMGFTAASVPHAMTNPGPEDLVYLLGGTRKPYDVSEYPKIGKRAYKFSGRRHTVSIKNVKES